jgi:hypothetical protein
MDINKRATQKSSLFVENIKKIEGLLEHAPVKTKNLWILHVSTMVNNSLFFSSNVKVG